jgi:hypothetical protein
MHVSSCGATWWRANTTAYCNKSVISHQFALVAAHLASQKGHSVNKGSESSKMDLAACIERFRSL